MGIFPSVRSSGSPEEDISGTVEQVPHPFALFNAILCGRELLLLKGKCIPSPLESALEASMDDLRRQYREYHDGAFVRCTKHVIRSARWL